MSNGPEDEPKTRYWKGVDPAIWVSGSKKLGRIDRARERLTGLVGFSSFWAVVLAGPFFVLMSFLVAYSVAGPALFGPVLILFWSLMVVGFVLAVEKSGYGRNFADKNYRLSATRLLAIPLAFVLIVGGFYLLLFLAKRF